MPTRHNTEKDKRPRWHKAQGSLTTGDREEARHRWQATKVEVEVCTTRAYVYMYMYYARLRLHVHVLHAPTSTCTCTTRTYVFMYMYYAHLRLHVHVLRAPTSGREDVPGIRSFHCSARSGLVFCNAAYCRVLIEVKPAVQIWKKVQCQHCR